MAFPKDFIWGAATSCYQIEGAALEDGRGECIWHRFSHTPGMVLNGDTGDTACDHYHRYEEDIQLMKELGLQAYRFSISWPRVLPQGIGAANEQGLDFYDRLIDTLLDAGITPFATLYHWDLPQVLQDKGGWENPDSINWFVEYTRLITYRLGDRVKNWATFNEPWVVAFVGNKEGRHAPGKTDNRAALKVAHHLLLSHGAAIPVIRATVPDAYAGIVITASADHTYSESEADRKAQQLRREMAHLWFLTPLYKGHYPAYAVEAQQHLLEGINLDAVKAANVPIDMMGLNYYTRRVFKANEDGNPYPPQQVPVDGAPHTEMEWEIYPDGLYEVLMELNTNFDLPDMYITENGAAFADPEPHNGVVKDPDRVEYLRGHFAAAERAIADGVPLKGYFVWSLMDNFEWGWGYGKRFGIIHVDFETQQRTFKQSANFYKDWIANQEVVPS